MANALLELNAMHQNFTFKTSKLTEFSTGPHVLPASNTYDLTTDLLTSNVSHILAQQIELDVP
jgi:hypothetical protein